MSKTHCIVIGGGLSGLSAAHTVIQGGGRVTLVEKKAFMGGNSTKATSGMNGAGTRTQKQMGVPDTTDIFEEDTIRGATSVKTGDCPPPYDLGRALTANSADAVHWIQDNFGLALDTVSRLGGHSQPRTHRSKNGTTFPGMEITYKLMTTFEDICLKSPQLAVLINKAPVQRLLTDEQTGRVIGVEYEKDGVLHQLLADAVVIASGGFGAGVLFPGSLLETLRPELMGLPTTNGDHCRGDGIVFARDIGAGTIDLEHVQVHPTGLVHMDDPDNKVKFLAAEALRGEGGILLDRDGNRFCDDLGTRDYVTRCMWEHNKPPYRLVLNSEATTNIAWHCKHYVGRRVMKFYENGSELAQDMGLTNEQLQKSFDSYNQIAESKQDPWGKKFFNGAPFNVDDQFNVAVVTPIVHYTMGGLLINAAAQCLKENSTDPVPGLFAAGEVTGGVHGKNRLGGSALLECVVFGRLAGSSVLEYTKLLNQALAAGPSSGSGQSSGSGSTISISIPQPSGDPIVVTVTGSGSGNAGGSATGEVTLPGVLSAATAFTTGRMVVETGSPSTAAPPDYVPGQKVFADEVDTKKVEAVKPSGEQKEYTLEEVAKHNKDGDVWVAVNGFVVDVTSFVDDHPGGKMALMTFAGRDATEEFNMVHEEGILDKYTPELIIGTVKPSAKL